MIKIMIGTHFEFEASHKLHGATGKCSKLHGHRYELEVKVTGDLNSEGFVCDFGDLKSIVNRLVIEQLDHTHLNDMFESPTAENIALWVYRTLHEATKDTTFHIVLIRLYETRRCYAEISLS